MFEPDTSRLCQIHIELGKIEGKHFPGSLAACNDFDILLGI